MAATMKYLWTFFLASFILNANVASSVSGSIDVEQLAKIFKENIQTKDLQALYYATKGYELLNLKVDNVVQLCKDLKEIKVEMTNIEQVFYLTKAATATMCHNSLTPDVMTAATRAMDKNEATMLDVYRSMETLRAIGKGQVTESQNGLQGMIEYLKKDGTVLNYGLAFHMCTYAFCEKWATEHLEEILSRADEVDGRILQWEGGLPVTSTTLTGILAIAEKTGAKPLTQDQADKFAEYLLSRRSVQTAKGAAYLLDAALALSKAKGVSPVSITLKGKKYIASNSDNIQVAITDLVGRPIPTLSKETVLAQSATRLADDVVVLSKQPLTVHPSDKSIYILDLMKVKPEYGLYKVALSAGTKTATLTVAVLGDIQVPTVEIGVGDIDGTSNPKTTTVQYPNTLAQRLEADHLQRVFLKFSIRDKAQNKPVTLQQAFVRVADSEDNEIIFIAEPDTGKSYKVDLNVGVISKHFGHNSGVYSVELLLGDSAIANPIRWKLTNINFKFGREPVQIATKSSLRAARPEIIHQFRAPEPRPPRSVSDVFAALCLAPLLLLLVLWARVGVNLSNFPCTLSAPIFHLGLGAILALYVLFWLQLSMFESIRYLMVLGLITFISGHRLLRHLVSTRKAVH